MSYRVSEDTVIGIWEKYSGREMAPDERGRARGHELVTQLRTYPKAVLLRAASTAQRRGEDLDWRSWQEWTDRHDRRRAQEEKDRKRKAAETAKRQAASDRTDQKFNSSSRSPSRYTTESGKASARAPGYSGGTLPHAKGRPSKHY